MATFLKTPFWRLLWEMRGLRKDLMATGGRTAGVVADLDHVVADLITVLDLRADRDTVLDIGCGVGYIAGKLAPLAKSVAGCDASSTLVARARIELAHLPTVDLFQAEAARIPRPDESYTRIVCYGVLHYFPSREYLGRFLREVRRLLTTDGLAFVGDISEKGKYDFDIAGRFGPIRRAWYKATTVIIDTVLQTRFSRDDVVRLAREAGLVAEIREQPPHLMFHESRFDVVLRKAR